MNHKCKSLQTLQYKATATRIDGGLMRPDDTPLEIDCNQIETTQVKLNSELENKLDKKEIKENKFSLLLFD